MKKLAAIISQDCPPFTGHKISNTDLVDANRVLSIITAIRRCFPNAAHDCTNGKCYELHRILKAANPGAEAYSNVEHVITKIGNLYFDINGVVEDTEGYLPIDAEVEKRYKKGNPCPVH